MPGGYRPGAGRPRGRKNKATMERELRTRQAMDALRAAAGKPIPDNLAALLPVDFLRLATIAAWVAGDVKLTAENADRWAQYVHPKKTDQSIGLTITDVRRIADLARAEAARRGLDVEPAAGDAAGAVPAG